MAGDTFESWWGALGVITKTTLISSFVCTALFTFKIVSPDYLSIDFEGLIWNLQLWRPISATVFLGKFGFPWLMNLATLYLHMKNHEEGDMAGKRADFVWMLMWLVGVLHIIAFFLGMPFISFAFIMSVCWVWCRRNPTAQLSIYMFKFEANYFPWALLAFHLLMGMDIVSDFVGIVAGHVFVFLKDILPKTHGKDLIPTPQWLIRLLPYERLGPFTVHTPAARAAPPAPGAHNWGGGRALGRQ